MSSLRTWQAKNKTKQNKKKNNKTILFWRGGGEVKSRTEGNLPPWPLPCTAFCITHAHLSCGGDKLNAEAAFHRPLQIAVRLIQTDLLGHVHGVALYRRYAEQLEVDCHQTPSPFDSL